MEFVNPGPTLFYKYQPINTYSLQNLSEDQLWISKPSAFNDPFEFKFELKNPRNINKHQSYNDFLSEMKNFGVICLSTHPSIASDFEIDDSNIHPENMLMWSHYANDHYGFVLGLRKNNDIQKVRYSNDFPIIEIDKPETTTIRQMLNAMYTKQKCWEYEHEYRIINTTQNSCGIPCRGFFEVERIYFGFRTSKSEKHLIKKITSGRGLKYYDTVLAKNRFQLHFEEV